MASCIANQNSGVQMPARILGERLHLLHVSHYIKRDHGSAGGAERHQGDRRIMQPGWDHGSTSS
jgi:hypothetical protein